MKSGRFLLVQGAMIVLLVLGMTSIPSAQAQLAVTTSTLNGTVSDAAGAVVPNAKVTLTSPERGITRTFTTGPQGNYSFSQLAPSTYQLHIQAPGFSEYIQNGINLDAGQTASQDVK